MKADGAFGAARAVRRLPIWLLGVAPLVAIVVAVVAFRVLDAPGLTGRAGPPVEELAVERTVLRPGTIELTVRNDGPDPVSISQVAVNDAYVPFTSGAGTLGRLASTTVSVPYPWVEGEAYEVVLLTSTGATVSAEIPVAVATPESDASFYGLMALLGIYVGVIPIALGMLWLPFVRRIGAPWMRVLMAVTVGLLAFLALDATIEGIDIGGQAAQAFGGVELVFLGAALAWLGLTAVESWIQGRRRAAGVAGRSGTRLAFLIAIGIGLHNLGEGLAIGSAYAAGALALGAFLVIGFALHNTTEGLAILAPVAARPVPLPRLAALGLIAGAPAILGAWIGASAYNPSIAALLIGAGAGAIVQVIGQLAPTLRDGDGRALSPATIGGIVAGMATLWATGLLVSV